MIHLLLHPKLASIPQTTLSSISQAILLDSTGLDVSNPIPSHLESPLPDIGPSSPSSTSWTISLLLPLLRSCLNNPPQAVIQLISRILSIVDPYPAPPFDVGLEASQLMGSLPDTISMPLRQSLSGLMTDLAISEGSAQPVTAGLAPTTIQSRPQAIDAGLSTGPEISSIKLSNAFSNVIPQTIALLLASYRDRVGYEANAKYAANPPVPSEGLQKLMKLCWALGGTGELMMEQLLMTTLQQVIPDTNGLKAHNVDACMLLLEGLPVVLRWWKDQSNGLAYPVSLPKCPILC